ncbi:hypothetical protein SH2C18_48000 [Clostridium sediminicola]|uniref:glycosyltransferase n=1 Tax=Clostridium sediminicola TaxID=3114879 RepID=UPI0031F20F1A
MKKILFITTKNILNTSGELRLIMNRAHALSSKWGIETEYIVLARNKHLAKKREKPNAINTTVLMVNKYNPVDIILKTNKLKSIIAKRIKSDNYNCVVLSGIGTLHLHSFVKKINRDIPVIADIHGSVEDIKEFAKGKSITKRIYLNLAYHYSRYSESKNLQHMDGIFVVSDALTQYLNKEYGLSDSNYYVVPCSIENNKNVQVDRKANREYYRKKYGIEANEKLFIYSGGVSPWQCIDKSIEIFNKLKDSNKNYKMLILSHKIQEILPMIKSYEDIITDSLDPSEVNKVLLAGDYAFLIRENIVTNHVAFPNKFLEYVQSGMKIITTPYVFDVANYVEQYDLGVVVDFKSKNEEKILEYINKNHPKVDNKREVLLKKVNFDYTLKNFVEDFEL